MPGPAEGGSHPKKRRQGLLDTGMEKGAFEGIQEAPVSTCRPISAWSPPRMRGAHHLQMLSNVPVILEQESTPSNCRLLVLLSLSKKKINLPGNHHPLVNISRKSLFQMLIYNLGKTQHYFIAYLGTFVSYLKSLNSLGVGRLYIYTVDP